MKIDLVQPRHSYAAETGEGQIYMPTSLLTAGARLMEAGVDVSFHDENVSPAAITADVVGVNLLGAPYIPEVISFQERVNAEHGDKTYFVGGRVISGLSEDQQTRLFGNETYSGNDDSLLANMLDFDEATLPPTEMTSLIPAYEQLDDSLMRDYLSREFSLSVSQGCKFACDFCAAVRTYRDPQTGVLSKVKETYRSIPLIQDELNYLVGRAKDFGLESLDLYMSNLDVFQTPDTLLKFAYAVQDVKRSNSNFDINMRGLATVDSFLHARDKKPDCIDEMVKAGFNTVGFGVDGWSNEVWKLVKKGHNTKEKCLEAIRSSREDFDITPEILMVFGHAGVDCEDTLKAAHRVTEMVVNTYGAIPRPHVSKPFIPGNNGWVDPANAKVVETLISNPDLFQSLDFTALPSPLTHPDAKSRAVAAEYFLAICDLPGNTTQFIEPLIEGMSPAEVEAVREFNVGRFDR